MCKINKNMNAHSFDITEEKRYNTMAIAEMRQRQLVLSIIMITDRKPTSALAEGR